MTLLAIPSLDELTSALIARYTAAEAPDPAVQQVREALDAYDTARRHVALRSLSELVGPAVDSPTPDLPALAQAVHDAVQRLAHLPGQPQGPAVVEDPVLDLPNLRASAVDRRVVLIVGGEVPRAVQTRLHHTVPGVLYESTNALVGTMHARLVGALAKGRTRGVIIVLSSVTEAVRSVIDMDCRERHVPTVDVTGLSYERLRAALVTLNRLAGEGPTNPPSAAR